MIRIPPHIGWPLLVVGLLSMSILASVITFLAARSDGGVQVVENYYQQALDYDQEAARKQASEALGWKVTLQVLPGSSASPQRPVTLDIVQADGQPLQNLNGTLQAFRPQRIEPVATVDLVADTTLPGRYLQTLPIHEVGLWDFVIQATDGTHHFEQRIRKEIFP